VDEGYGSKIGKGGLEQGSAKLRDACEEDIGRTCLKGHVDNWYTHLQCLPLVAKSCYIGRAGMVSTRIDGKCVNDL
jgi:hypothetical protein